MKLNTPHYHTHTPHSLTGCDACVSIGWQRMHISTSTRPIFIYIYIYIFYDIDTSSLCVRVYLSSYCLFTITQLMHLDHTIVRVAGSYICMRFEGVFVDLWCADDVITTARLDRSVIICVTFVPTTQVFECATYPRLGSGLWRGF